MKVKPLLQGATVVVVLGLLALLIWKVSHQGKSVKVGAAAPAFALSRLDAPGKLKLASYRGKVVVLNFWASWCVDCKLEAKTLHDAAARWGSKAVFVGVDTKDFASAARRYMHRYAVDYTVVRDVDGAAGDRWGVTGYPETFFITPRGKVIPPHVNGPIPAAQLNDSIRKALAS
jgi:cytochrome c biogenesis protein CcmG/thiol:disulfide interchange protein DsbE